MLTIKKHSIRKRITLDDFMKLKKDEHGPFMQMRQDAKSTNFAFLFGAVASTFARRTLETAWSESQADQYIKDNDLRNMKDKIIAKYPRETPFMWKLITCASDIRTKFFKTYPGLINRIERERLFATEHGYVRCWHGACRRIPELFFMSRNDNGRLNGDDEKLYGKLVGNLLNIAANTSIQNLEAKFVMAAIVDLQKWLKESKMKTFITGSVHDSIDLSVYKDELDTVCKKMREICCISMAGMPLDVDITYADIAKKEWYKGGKVWKEAT